MVNYASCTLKTFFNTSLQLKGDSGNYFKIPTGILLLYFGLDYISTYDWIIYLCIIGLHVYFVHYNPVASPPPSLDEGMAKQLDQPSLPIKKKEDINNYARPSDYSLK